MIRQLVPATFVLAVLFAPVMAQAQNQSQGSGSITIEGSLNISALRPIVFATTSVGETTAATESPAVIEVTGDPGRVYRITLPEQIVNAQDRSVVDRLTVVSETSGDVSRVLTARMGPDGRDRLRISGRLSQINGLSFGNVTTAVPLRVDYE